MILEVSSCKTLTECKVNQNLFPPKYNKKKIYPNAHSNSPNRRSQLASAKLRNFSIQSLNRGQEL